MSMKILHFSNVGEVYLLMTSDAFETLRYLGSPNLKTKKEKIKWLAEKLGKDPSKIRVEKEMMSFDGLFE